VPSPIAVAPPGTKAEILAEMVRIERECDGFWNAFPIDAFLSPIGTAWSPADNVRHLLKSVRPVTLALRLPRFVLAVLFGRAQRASRSYDELRREYRAALDAGATAGGRFRPAPLIVSGDREAWRQGLMTERERTGVALRSAIAPWSEKDLDTYRLPHPLIGKLTLREMLFFSLLHGVHHVDNVIRRQAEAARG
jgi:hypothetical protein